MTSRQHILFFEKLTRKLADTFNQLNQMCLQQLTSNLFEQKKQPVESNIQDIELLPDEPNDIESPQEEILKEAKSKKIKKDAIPSEEPKQISEGRTKKKQKKVSHKPKAPASSFLLFFKQQQANISKSYPTYGVTELTKVAAKCWNELSEQQKQPYIKLCEQERRLYQQRMHKYRIQFPDQIAEKEKDRKQLKKEKKNIKQTPVKQKCNPQQPMNLEVVEINPQPVNISDYISDSNDGQEGADSLGIV